MIELKNISMTFNKWGLSINVLSNVNLKIQEGEWIMISGDNGSGKTTLLNIINAGIQPSSGNVLIDNHSIDARKHYFSTPEVFMVHQNPLLGTVPTLTVFENLYLADERTKRPTNRNSILNEYSNLLEPLALDHRIHQLARLLSGGERQLLAILIARIRNAKYILLDEPFSSLDPIKYTICLKEIVKLHNSGKTIIMVSHNTDLISNYGTRKVMLRKGEIISNN